MKKILLLIFITNLFSQQAAVENVQVAQRTDGSKIVDITYDLLPDEIFQEFDITVEFSINDGSEWIIIPNTCLEGNMYDQSAGENILITWDLRSSCSVGQGYDFTNFYNDNMNINIKLF